MDRAHIPSFSPTPATALHWPGERAQNEKLSCADIQKAMGFSPNQYREVPWGACHSERIPRLEER
jgi:hypothetical protein